ncbi:Bacterial extracellular solute-binding protein [Bifidobacterium goeldii]|uniref:Bacterial extracellular solute-binding protein n=1 Tax=Bifidobacterium goeldii TaxID=2306975 RepID=A0A430FFX6_9BIFI|nr:substrate-binding domain-containing protein [Bifidobacterium goeldii]RSX51737.1 Bacterial extracellular solute-binding protein [Bifidobacterium goeldii]
MMRITKSKIIGLIALLVVFLLIGGILVWRGAQPKPVELTSVNGYLGGEKIGLFDDSRFKKIAADNGLDVNYRKAGSLAMMDADRKGMDYLFPSSRAAVEYGKAKGVDTSKGDIVFNSPIVLYTHKAVADALVSSGIMSHDGGVYRMDMAKAVDAMVNNTTWADLGWTSGYGQFRIDSTDPVKSNSGNEYAALIATVLNNGQPATVESLNRDGATIASIFAKSGWMETSSEDSFNQFLNLGVGSKPIMVGYESQILDLAANDPDAWNQVKDDVVIVYPTPTVWSTHVFIPTDDTGEQLLKLLKSADVQKLAWEKHGFRAANFNGTSSISRFKVPGTLEQIDAVSELPSNDAMQQLISTLSKGQ